MTIADILDKIRELSTSPADMGRQFEKLVKFYLYNSPIYNEIDAVWLWNEFPYRGSQTDSGVDLVARTVDDKYWAIQCKFYQPGSQISKSDIDSFLAASSVYFTDGSGSKKTFSARLVVATVEVSATARAEMTAQTIPATFLHAYAFDNAGIDWDKFWEQFVSGGDVSNVEQKKYTLREHQRRAFNDVITGFQTADRGKLIMACGTGKTFTSLKIAEKMAPPCGLVLYAVPSLALLGQTLGEWSIHSERTLRPILVCSDTSINEQDKRKKKALEDESEILPSDLALPATTKAKDVVEQYRRFAEKADNGYIVVFSTYQSLEVIKNAQKKGLPEFDLIVCDEAHRTTGISLDESTDDSAFMLVHDDKNVKGKKRLYMTATPRIYGNSAKDKAKDMGVVVICSMDDEKIYGRVFHELSFGEAVKQDLLTDYKVIIITVSERRYKEFLQFERFSLEEYRNQFPRLKKATDEEVQELMISDLAKMFGCWQGLVKRSYYLGADGKLTNDFASDPLPMKTAVAFASTIKVSKNIVKPWFEELSSNIEQWQNSQREIDPNFNEPKLKLRVKHVDGTIVANERAERIHWLETGEERLIDSQPMVQTCPDADACRILTNVRCLSEGVDVPALDAVIFLSPRNSKVDIVQSVGRVMRKAPGKKYGYIILPVAIPDEVDPERVLDNNDRFKVVWDVLQTLRSHDDRLRIEINKLRFKDDTPEPGPFGGNGGGGDDEPPTLPLPPSNSPIVFTGISELNEHIRARVVKRCGDRDYLEESAKEIALIAQQHVEQIKKQLEHPTPQQKQAFDEFLERLQQDLNPSIDQNQAIEMIAQHIIMQPVFDALFADYPFAKKNVVSQAFEKLLETFQEESSQEEWAKLEKVRKSIRDRVDGITSWRHKQTVITNLYDKFFKIAAEKTAERLGIVYTPVEVVDFIIHSVEHILQTEFDKSMNNRNVHILDPFTGTGTFIVQLLQSGIIKPDGRNFAYKFNNELHANEIVLLAYYIAAINIEQTFHSLGNRKKYSAFPGLVLTDTFQTTERELPENADMPTNVLGDDNEEEVENDERILRQRRSTIEVIIGNPPYSVGQGSANDNNQNQKYPKLDKRVEETYVAKTNVTNKNSLYDSYIKAFRWASDRIGNKGVIGFITNNGWIEKNTMDGFRKCLIEEFTSIYVFNLRGAVKGRSGDYAKKEGGNVFDIMTGVAIVILVKNPEKAGQNCQIFYHDIGDYLTRAEKKRKIKEFHDISQLPLQTITPNRFGDWINQRGEDFSKFYPLGEKKGEDKELQTFFEPFNSPGVGTSRDAWVYNYSKKELSGNMRQMVSFYNQQLLAYDKYIRNHPNATIEEFMSSDSRNLDATRISWSSSLTSYLQRGLVAKFEPKEIRIGLYRPFCKSYLYWGDKMIHRRGKFPYLLPTESLENLVICIEAPGARRDFSCIITNLTSDYHVMETTQCFPLYYYTAEGTEESDLFGEGGSGESVDGFVRHDAVTDAILARAREQYGVKSITKKDLFYYVYGFLHSKEYRARYAADLKKSLARIPLVKSYTHFREFVDAGEKLALLHLNYDSPDKLDKALKQINRGVSNKFQRVSIKRSLRLSADSDAMYRVAKMRFPKRDGQDDKTIIVYNEQITLENIPLDAYEYVVNGKSAIEWVMERYQVKTDPASQITNDPNLWEDGKNPQYILELLESVITVSVITMKIVNALPKDWEA